MTTSTVAAPGAAVWNATINLNPSPIYFGNVHTDDSTPAYGYTTIYNPNLGIATAFSEFGAGARTWHTDAMNAWSTNTRSYRMLYASTTVTLSSNAQSNQGNMTCAQYDTRPSTNYDYDYQNLTENPVLNKMHKTIKLWTHPGSSAAVPSY